MPLWAIIVDVILAGLALVVGAAFVVKGRRRADSRHRQGLHHAGAARVTPSGKRADESPIRPVRVPAQGHGLDQLTTIELLHRYPDDYLIVSPPMVMGNAGQTPLRDWLIHYHTMRGHVWPAIVTEFYKRAAANPDVADYFAGVNMPQLQRHFVRVVILLTGDGLTVGTLKSLRESHFLVMNSHGEAITSEIFDEVVETLVAVLVDEGVPGAAMEQLAKFVQPLKDVIVREPNVPATSVFAAH